MRVAEKVDMKHLVMTGKEHGLPRAVSLLLFFHIQAGDNHSLLFFQKKEKIEIMDVIGGSAGGGVVVVALKCQRQGSLTGLLSAMEYQYGFFQRI